MMYHYCGSLTEKRCSAPCIVQFIDMNLSLAHDKTKKNKKSENLCLYSRRLLLKLFCILHHQHLYSIFFGGKSTISTNRHNKEKVELSNQPSLIQIGIPCQEKNNNQRRVTVIQKLKKQDNNDICIHEYFNMVNQLSKARKMFLKFFPKIQFFS